MKITILGCYAATPRTLNNPTSQVLEINNKLFLIDCGEGTQVQLRKNKIKFSKIAAVFISHLHGDHFFGLIGLISTFSLLGRVTDLMVYGPKGIKEIIDLQLKLSNSYPNFKLIITELESAKSEVIHEDAKVIVKTIPLKHRIYTNGFLFKEKEGDRKLNIEAIENYQIDKSYYLKIKKGGDVTLETGEIIPNQMLSFDGKPTKSYAFCSDTVYHEAIVPIIKNATVLYHETTFLETETELAKKTMHTTASQAATIARLAGVETLIIGHYSTRYYGILQFKEEAKKVFENIILANDGAEFEFK